MRFERKTSTVIGASLVAVALQAGGTGAADAAAPANQLMVSAIHVAPDYRTSHVVVATVSQLHCSSQCTELLLSHDGGATWVRAAARGWSGGVVFPATAGASPALITAGSGGIAWSRDGGGSFTVVSRLDGTVDVTAAHGRTFVLVSPAPDHGALLLTLPGGAVTALPGPSGSYSRATLWFNPAYPDVDSSTPAAVAEVVSEQNTVALQLCDRSFTCHGTGPFPSGSGIAGVAVSPHYLHDHTLFALTAKGLVETHDGGSTYVLAAIAPGTAATVAQTVVGLATTPDFDAAGGTGDVLAAMDSVSKTASSGSASSAVYRSQDGVRWSPLAASGPADGVLTALALMPDRRALAGRIDFSTHTAGMYCSPDWTTWSTACPAVAAVTASSGSPGTRAGGGGALSPPGVHAATSGNAAAGAAPASDDGNVAVARTQRAGAMTGARRLAVPAALIAAVLAAGAAVMRRRRRRGRAAHSSH